MAEAEATAASSSNGFKKFTLVTIHGLQSESGKKLNGSQGIILNDKGTTKDGVTRFPVRIYALNQKPDGEDNDDNDIPVETDSTGFVLSSGGMSVLKGPTFKDMLIKETNLNFCPDISEEDTYNPNKDVFVVAFNHYMMTCGSQLSLNDTMFWLEAHHLLRGHDSYPMSITYARALSTQLGQHEKAAKTLSEVLDNHRDAIHQDERFRSHFCRDFAETFAVAGPTYADLASEYTTIMNQPIDASESQTYDPRSVKTIR